MRNRVSIKAVQAFEAAARLGSFALAADELAVTPSAVSHQVKLLEDQLGARLFLRVHRSVVLTDAGRVYAAEVTAAFARIEHATRNFAAAPAGAILTVHSTPSFATQWLVPRLASFKELNPGIDIRLYASLGPVDLAADGVDVQIRYNAGPPRVGTVLIPFPPDTIVPMCAPALASGPNPIRCPADLCRHTLIHSEVNIVSWRDWARRHKIQLDLERGPRFDRSFMAISAAIDGLGVCLDSPLLAERELASGKLVVPLPADGMKAQGHAFVTLKSTVNLPTITLFRDWLFGELAKAVERRSLFLGPDDGEAPRTETRPG
jgi:LysR family glycine cleavage system transcriptional activator